MKQFSFVIAPRECPNQAMTNTIQNGTLPDPRFGWASAIPVVSHCSGPACCSRSAPEGSNFERGACSTVKLAAKESRLMARQLCCLAFRLSLHYFDAVRLG